MTPLVHALPNPLAIVASEIMEVDSLLSVLGASDGEYLHHVVQTLLSLPRAHYYAETALLISHAVSGTVSPQVIQFAVAVEIVAVAAVAHRRMARADGLVPQDEPAIDGHLVVLAGDYLYAQAAYMTASLENLHVMAALAETIRLQCVSEATSIEGGSRPRSAYLYTLSAKGTGHLLDVDSDLALQLEHIGRQLDAASLSTQARVPNANLNDVSPGHAANAPLPDALLSMIFPLTTYRAASARPHQVHREART